MKKKLNQITKNLFRLLSRFHFLILLLGMLLLGSCSIIGLINGIVIDSSNRKEKTIGGWETQSLHSGQELKLLLKDSSTIEGKFNNVTLIPQKEYIALYEFQKQQLPDGLILPALGDSVSFSLKSNDSLIASKKHTYKFEGFEMGNFLINSKISNSIGHLPFSMIDKMSDQHGNIITGFKANELVLKSLIPTRSVIEINNKNAITKVNPMNILEVSAKSKKSNAALSGFLIGASIDALILLVISSAAASSFGNLPTGGFNFGGSCPYVYSFDGDQYILDSETFGGAIFKAVQRTDLDNLDHLKEFKGRYRLKLTNELEENQYIDEFKLMVVDHPVGSKLVPSFNGELHALNSLNPPIKAIDKNGNNVLDLVKTKDQKVWISNPFGRNPEIKSDGRDAMILEFNKPKNSKHVKLAFNVQNTVWAANMQVHMLSLHGNKLNDWYALMNSSKIAQSSFKQIMIREGMLLIQLWDGKSWQTRDYVWEVGPRVAKDQVITLDLGNYSEENLRIRLETTVGFWMINSVEADYGEDLPIRITELSAIEAIDQSGNNLLEVLNKNDERYYEMPNKTDWADIIFKAIPKMKNNTRSFILKCNGYYIIHADDTGEAKQELLNKLISEPGAYGQYALNVLNQSLANSFHNQNLE